MTIRFRALAAALAVAAAPPAVADSGLSFDTVFAAAGQPRFLRYDVRYRAGTAVHRLTVWRDGDRRLKRVTDGALTMLAEHPGGAPDFRLMMVDPRRRIVTTVSRENLYRVGGFTDWYDLAHGLRHPRGAYRLTAGTAPAAMPATPAPCRWYDLAQAGRVTRLCWDAADRLPLLIVDAAGRLVWRVDRLSPAPIAAPTFAVDTRGYTRVDADADIHGD